MIRELVGTRVVKAFRAQTEDVLEELRGASERTFLLDTWSLEASGGTGQTFDWRIAREAAGLGNLILAGGLTPDNVGEAVRSVPEGSDMAGRTGVRTEDRGLSALRPGESKLQAGISVATLPA